MYVIAVNKSQEFLLNVRRLFICFLTTTQRIRLRRRVDVFSTTSYTICYGWGATSEYRFEIGDFAPTPAGWPKISGRSGRPTNHSSQKTRAKWHFVWYKNLDRSPFSFVTIHAFERQTDWQTDRQTDGRTPFLSLVRADIQCSAEINECMSVKHED